MKITPIKKKYKPLDLRQMRIDLYSYRELKIPTKTKNKMIKILMSKGLSFKDLIQIAINHLYR